MKLFLPLFAFILLFSCASQKNIRTFYVDKGVIQYFVRASDFSGDVAGCEIDFTYRHDENAFNPVICNFTVETSDRALSKIDSAKFLVDEKEFILSGLDMFFREIEEKRIRYTGNIYFEQFAELIQSKKAYFVVYSGERAYQCESGGDFCSKAESAYREIVRPIQDSK